MTNESYAWLFLGSVALACAGFAWIALRNQRRERELHRQAALRHQRASRPPVSHQRPRLSALSSVRTGNGWLDDQGAQGFTTKATKGFQGVHRYPEDRPNGAA